MIDILTVCTGNICRSPLAELALRTRLGDLSVQVSSAGTQGLRSAPMTSDAQRLAREAGVPATDADAHRSRFLTETMLSRPDLVLALTRDHRTRILSMWPAATRRTFTVREFARLASTISDEEFLASAGGASTPEERLRAMGARIAMERGVAPRVSAEEDDVIDPYRREWSVYEESASQLLPALDQVERIVRLAA